MADRIIMPKQGLQMTEGTITSWLKSEGDSVGADEPLFEMETDKCINTVCSPVSGTLLKVLAAQGATVPVAEMIAIVGQLGEDISGLLEETGGAAGQHTADKKPAASDVLAAPEVLITTAVPVTTEAPVTTAVPVTTTVPVTTEAPVTTEVLITSEAPAFPDVRITHAITDPEGRVFISPRAKMRADELGIDHTRITGSAPDGMIIERDILQAGLPGPRNIVPYRGIRKVIAERMKQSLNENAQTEHRISVRMDAAADLRAVMNKAISYNDFINFATVRALQEFPAINAELTGAGIWIKDFINIGIAVALSEGLVVPVVKDTGSLSLIELSAAVKELAEKARDRKLKPDDCTGGSFTISNLGMYGLDDFVAIINPPESGILAIGKIEDTPVAVDGRVEIHPVMKMTLSYDHRVIDGAPAALFLARIKEYLEHPYLMSKSL